MCGLHMKASEYFDLPNHLPGSPLSCQVESVLAAPAKAPGLPSSVPVAHPFPTLLILPLVEHAQAWGCFSH